MIPRILNLLGFGRASLVQDDGPQQLLQLTEPATGTGGAERVTDHVPRMGEYGFSSSPPAGSEVLALRRNGDRGLAIVVATAHRPSRPRGLQGGDVWLYDDRGRSVRLTGHGIEINAGGGEVTVTAASKLRCECDVETTGDIVARADGSRVSLNALHDAYNLHKHPPVAGPGTWGAGPPVPQAGGAHG